MKQSEFENLVYSFVEMIPRGKVETYGRIAAAVGFPGRARGVGKAMHGAPCDVPAHRVVNSSGRTAPQFSEQRGLLVQEGVKFRKNGTVDIKNHLWIK